MHRSSAPRIRKPVPFGCGQAGNTAENLAILYFRCLAAVTVAAEAVENALGLPPLPEPEEQT